MGKIYFKLLALIAILVAVFGVAGPYLISEASTELVLGGFVLIFVITVPAAFYLIRSIVRDASNLINKEEDKNA